MNSCFHILAYKLTEAASMTASDMAAVTDPIFSQRNSHFIFSEKYKLLAAQVASVHATGARANIPTWNAIGRHNIWPVEVSANAGRQNNYPRVADYRDMPLDLPVNEEIAWELATNSSGSTASTATLAMAVAPSIMWNQSLPPGQQRLTINGSITANTLALAWSGANAITFSDNLRGGWYCVNGCWVWNNATGNPARYFRLFFPRAQEFNGRILRPGGFVTDTVGNMEIPGFVNGFGEWGRFHTFEPPQMEVFTDAAETSKTWNIRMDISYLGTNPTY